MEEKLEGLALPKYLAKAAAGAGLAGEGLRASGFRWSSQKLETQRTLRDTAEGAEKTKFRHPYGMR